MVYHPEINTQGWNLSSAEANESSSFFLSRSHGCLICIFLYNYFTVWKIGHPDTKLLTKQKHIILLNLLSFANCLLGGNLFDKWEFSSPGGIMYFTPCQRTRLRTTQESGFWLREDGDILQTCLQLWKLPADSWPHWFACSFQIPSSLQPPPSVFLGQKETSARDNWVLRQRHWDSYAWTNGPDCRFLACES